MATANTSNGQMLPEIEIRELLGEFKGKEYYAEVKDFKSEIEDKCREYMQKDYPNLIIVDNIEEGGICGTYPGKLFIPKVNDHLESSSKNDEEPSSETTTLTRLMREASLARCRTRFPVPVILLGNRYICRSGSLADIKEVTVRKPAETVIKVMRRAWNMVSVVFWGSEEPQLEVLTVHRDADVKLLEYLGVKIIADLMVEDRKVKYGMYVCSSEKAEGCGRYSRFDLLGIPYPGCEFFANFHGDGRYDASNLYYEWEQEMNNAKFTPIVSNEDPSLNDLSPLGIRWDDYKSWDVIELTKNYLKLLLFYLKKTEKSSSGLLIHCISGWDRTPLFISLLRLTLWADGKIHETLNEEEITYLTVGYDWFLFGHVLRERLERKEAILYFCFYFLQHIEGDEFAYVNIDCEQAQMQPCSNRREKLKRVRTLFAKAYSQNVGPLPEDHLR